MLNRVLEIRKKKGFTQTKLAEKAEISRPYLSAIENNNQDAITNVVMVKIAAALGETVPEIFFADM